MLDGRTAQGQVGVGHAANRASCMVENRHFVLTIDRGIPLLTGRARLAIGRGVATNVCACLARKSHSSSQSFLLPAISLAPR